MGKYEKYKRGKERMKRWEEMSIEQKRQKTLEMMRRIKGKHKPPKGAIPYSYDQRDKDSKNGCAICGKNDILYDSGWIYVCDDCLHKMGVRSGHNYVVARSFFPVEPVQCNVCKKKYDLMRPKLMHIVRANVCSKCLFWLGYTGQGKYKFPKALR